ncbi:hypothetical protein [Salinimonas chungwhensis]|uniref:hypothetical protein n=1 Tax=Salinimonas chungwhensis TaxID=265425 RepID=UPI00037882CF|nr:hypothetical protein [Salinimonas chungwhensis]
MSDNTLWHDYITQNFHRYISTVENSEWKGNSPADIDIEQVRGQEPKLAYAYLREFMQDSAIKRLQNRFRAHKHREITGLKNIQLKEHYLRMLDRFKDQVGAASYEEALDFLLSPDYQDYQADVNAAKEKVGAAEYNSDELFLSGFMSRLTKYDRQRVALAIEKTYFSAWRTAKQSKKRTGDPKREYLNEFCISQNINGYLKSRVN